MRSDKLIWIGLVAIGILGIIVEAKYNTLNLISFIISLGFIVFGFWIRKRIR